MRLQIAPEVLPVVLPFLEKFFRVPGQTRGDSTGLGLAIVQEIVLAHGGTISVIAEDAGTECVISVEDDGVGMDPGRLRDEMTDSHLSGAHVGLGNVHDRLRSAFGDDYGLIVETERGAGMKVSLRVPKFRVGVPAGQAEGAVS